MPMIIEENIMVPMRDGVKLATDIYRPAQVGQWPVLLTRLPYNKDLRFPMPHLHDKRSGIEPGYRAGGPGRLCRDSSGYAGTICLRGESKEDGMSAINRASHSNVFPSHLALPIIERERADEGAQGA